MLFATTNSTPFLLGETSFMTFVCVYFVFRAADVQRLDLKDCNLYGVSPSDPGPMVLCNQCNHIMAPEGIMRHVKRVHGSKIVPSPSIKLRIPAKGSSTVGSILSTTTTSNIHRLTNNSNSTVTSQTATSAAAVAVAAAAAESSLSTEFSNRLNVSKMAPPTPINASTGMKHHHIKIIQIYQTLCSISKFQSSVS